MVQNPLLQHMILMWKEIAEHDQDQAVIRSLYMVTKEMRDLLLSKSKP